MSLQDLALRTGNVLEEHLLLAQAMAHRHGVNLSEAIHQGVLSRPDFAKMIDRCRECPGNPADCRDYIEDDRNASAAPPWCANAPILDGLRGLV